MTVKRKSTPNRKRSKRKPREIAREPRNPFIEYGQSFPGQLSVVALAEIENDPGLFELVRALHANDKSDGANVAPLVEVLRSTGTTFNKFLADWISRYVHVKPKGRPQLPIYRMTEDHAAMESAICEVGDLRDDAKLRGQRLSINEAITRVAERRGIDNEKLASWQAGQARAKRKKK